MSETRVDEELVVSWRCRCGQTAWLGSISDDCWCRASCCGDGFGKSPFEPRQGAAETAAEDGVTPVDQQRVAPHAEGGRTLLKTWFEFCLFTPRWHGWARWEYAVAVPFTSWTYGREVVAHGWTRRPKGSRYVTFNTRPEEALHLADNLRRDGTPSEETLKTIRKDTETSVLT